MKKHTCYSIVLFFLSLIFSANLTASNAPTGFDIKKFNYQTNKTTSEVVNQTWYVAKTFQKKTYSILRRSVYLDKHPKDINSLIKTLNQYGHIIEKNSFANRTLYINLLHSTSFIKSHSAEDFNNYLAALVFTLCEAPEVNRVQFKFPNADLPSISYTRKKLISLGIIPLIDDTPPKIHHVKQGDTFFSIEKRYQTPQIFIKNNNYLEPNTAILLRNSDIFICTHFKKVKIHTVKSGEILYQIAKQYQMPVSEVYRINNLSSDYIYPQQRLLVYSFEENNLIPLNQELVGIHTVHKKETLYSISKKYNVAPENIMANNSIESDRIFPNQELILTRSTSAVPVSYSANQYDLIEKGMSNKGISTYALPEPTAQYPLPRFLFDECTLLQHVDVKLKNAFLKKHYSKLKYNVTHGINGFRFITELEQINSDGTSKKDQQIRFGQYIDVFDDRDGMLGLVEHYLKALIFEKTGYFRVFVVTVSPSNNVFAPTESNQVGTILDSTFKENHLPWQTLIKSFDKHYKIEVLAYVFKRGQNGAEPEFLFQYKHGDQEVDHLKKAGLFSINRP